MTSEGPSVAEVLPIRQSRRAIAGTAHGTAAPVLRLIATSADQMPCGTRAKQIASRRSFGFAALTSG
jgi:hypothetical protein